VFSSEESSGSRWGMEFTGLLPGRIFVRAWWREVGKCSGESGQGAALALLESGTGGCSARLESGCRTRWSRRELWCWARWARSESGCWARRSRRESGCRAGLESGGPYLSPLLDVPDACWSFCSSSWICTLRPAIS
jgi:hypothetical protein